MEQYLTYEFALQTVVYTAFFMLIMFDCYWIGYLIIHCLKWCYKKLKGFLTKIKRQ